MAAKAEINDYTTTTRFGGRQKIQKDAPVPRPATRPESLSRIEEIYRENKWRAREQAQNHELNGLPVKLLDHYSDDQLKIILADMEKRGMIIYEN